MKHSLLDRLYKSNSVSKENTSYITSCNNIVHNRTNTFKFEMNSFINDKTLNQSHSTTQLPKLSNLINTNNQSLNEKRWKVKCLMKYAHKLKDSIIE